MTTALLNKDVFAKDPTQLTIPNHGVAKVTEPSTPQEWETLEYELRSFVCEGEYKAGLERVLSRFLANLDQPQQPAAWISGFYGSGKSHFVRVLEFLWRDVAFPDGERARSKVDLPDEIKELLRELSVQGRRHGGLWSAAGTLSASASGGENTVRLGMLGIIFRSAGLPSQYGRARFVLWLKREGLYERVVAEVAAAGRDFSDELNNMYVSPTLHKSVFAALPEFAASAVEVGKSLRAQFPANPADVSDDDLLEAITEVLHLKATEAGFPGKLPLTLIVFDELQQFIGEDSSRTLQVQQVVESCSTRFGSSVLFVGTGQAQLMGNPELQKLRGRFTVQVMLDETDVERVVREVVLRKDETKVPALEDVLERASGEIDRHLTNTQIAPGGEDKNDLVPDYPLLPTRRRFWEAALRAIDTQGTAGQLRTQLRVVLEANREVARKPLGHVVGADVIFDQLQNDMLQSGALLAEQNRVITLLRDGSEDGRLKSRLCALAFIIGKLPPADSGPASTGVRATKENLADLLVEDLTGSDAALRGRIDDLLDVLVQGGTMMLVGDEYRLQTREGMLWEQDYSQRLQRARSDAIRLTDERARRLRLAVEARLKGTKLLQGQSKTPREIELHFGQEPPAASAGKIPVWIRDAWATSDKSVREDARSAGTDSPVVFVFLPQRHASELRDAVAGALAAEETLNARGQPSSDDGKQAQESMRSRQRLEEDRRQRLIGQVVDGGLVFQGGGAEVGTESLAAAVQAAADDSMTRLFPEFARADHPRWDKVAERAQAGAGDALANVGHTGDPADHRVCRDVRVFVGPGKRGSEAREHFRRPPYGWPQDAIDAALVVMTGGGLLRATKNGQPQTPKALNKQQISTVDFVSEEIIITKAQLLALRGLFSELGQPTTTDDQVRSFAPVVLQRLLDMAAQAGGAAPLPAVPATTHIRELQGQGGSTQLLAIYNQMERLRENHKSWQEAKKRIAARLPRWERLQRLLTQGQEMPAIDAVRPQIAAIAENGNLLNDPDPLPPLAKEVSTALRNRLSDVRSRLVETRKREISELEAAPEWTKLADSMWRDIFAKVGLGDIPHIETGTDEHLLAELEATPIAAWEERIIALPQRAARARILAAEIIEPKVVPVTPPHATLRSPAEVETYLDMLREKLLAHINAGNPVAL